MRIIIIIIIIMRNIETIARALAQVDSRKSHDVGGCDLIGLGEKSSSHCIIHTFSYTLTVSGCKVAIIDAHTRILY